MVSALPLDVLPIIFSHLTILDILRVRLVNKAYLYITKTHTLWHAYILRHFLQPNLPLPGLSGRSLEVLDAEELENLALRAERYRRNWTSPEPVQTNRVTFTAIPESRIIALNFFSQNGESWLLSLTMTQASGLRAFTFQCWDLKHSPPVCIARRILHHFAGMAFNSLSTGRAVVAVKTPEICLIGINPVASRSEDGYGYGGASRSPAQACVNVAVLDDRAAMNLMLAGDLVLTQDDMGRAFLYHFERPQTRVELVDPEGNVQPERILSILEGNGWVMVARSTTVELYPLPTPINHSLQIEPIARHRWQYKVDSILISRPVDNSRDPISPIHLVLRYGSIHPWPINLLHRYVLNSNDLFSTSLPVNRLNNPYSFPPVASQVIGSPIRLMATYDMAVGSYGTIIYIDSHTESYFGHSNFGQRLAGTRVDAQLDNGAGGEVDPAIRETSVYAVSEQDEWTRIALQEEEGKVAIGHVDGQITVLDFA